MSKSSRQRKNARRLAQKQTINNERHQPGQKVLRKANNQREFEMTAGGGNNYH